MILDSKLNFEKCENFRILDYGCGFGHALSIFDALGFATTGIEIDNIRRSHSQSIGHHVASDLTNIQNESFKAVYSSFVIEHVHDLNSYFKDIYRVLEKGGYCLILGVNEQAIWDEKRTREFKNVDPIEHLNYLSRKGVKKLVNRNGFEVVGRSRILKKVLSGSTLPLNMSLLEYLLEGNPRFKKHAFKILIKKPI